MEPTFITRPGTYDQETITEVIRREVYLRRVTVEAEDIWLDVGANIGAFSVQAALRGATVVAYEPDFENFKLLVKNISKNKLSDKIIIEKKCVVGGETGKREFFINQKTNKATHSLLVKRGRLRVVVDAENINEILMRNKANKIKMDCEGAEVEILNALDFKKAKLDAVIVEFHFAILRDKTKKIYHELISLLKKKNFDTVVFNPDPKGAWTTILHAVNK